MIYWRPGENGRDKNIWVAPRAVVCRVELACENVLIDAHFGRLLGFFRALTEPPTVLYEGTK